MNKGDLVTVYKGRKNVGITGTLFWSKTETYGFHRSGVNPLRVVTRVGIRMADDTVVWDYLSNCQPAIVREAA
jgi:hypothetical protein